MAFDHGLRVTGGIIGVLSAGLTMAGCSVNEGLPVLTEDTLGPLELREGKTVSLEMLQDRFPSLALSESQRVSESGEFLYFEFQDDDGQRLFSIRASTGDQQQMTMLEIHDPRIPDKHGVRVGDGLGVAIDRRGSELDFGPAHHHVYLGADRIFYHAQMEQDPEGPDISPEDIGREEALNSDWAIVTISWPGPTWSLEE